MITTLILLTTIATTGCEQADAQRIQQHLLETWSDLSAHPPPGLTAEQLAARRRNLDELHRYALQGVFPVNRDFEERTPYFIDERGTRCAMADLIEISGGGEFVAKVHRERNNAYVRELADDPALHAWLKANGLTLAEAARIQPTYTRCEAWRTTPVCAIAPATAVPVEATITSITDAGVLATVEVVHGTGSAVTAGQQLNLGLAEDFGGFIDVYAPGTRVYTRVTSTGYPEFASPIDAQGRVWYALDRKCASRPSTDVATAVALSTDAGHDDCVAALIERDPAYGLPFCVRVGSFMLPTDFCNDDGGVNVDLLPADAGLPDAGVAAEDAGQTPTPDGGYEPLDSGVPPTEAIEDAGESNDAGSTLELPDSGNDGPVETGCTAGPGAWVIALLATSSLALRRNRRR